MKTTAALLIVLASFPSIATALAAATAATPHASDRNAVLNKRDTAANWTIGQTVKTTSGSVTGHAAKNDSTVSEYLGIPFGKAPVGNLRFAAPQKFTGSAALNGSSYVSVQFLFWERDEAGGFKSWGCSFGIWEHFADMGVQS
jgi:hypothetical protein